MAPRARKSVPDPNEELHRLYAQLLAAIERIEAEAQAAQAAREATDAQVAALANTVAQQSTSAASTSTSANTTTTNDDDDDEVEILQEPTRFIVVTPPDIPDAAAGSIERPQGVDIGTRAMGQYLGLDPNNPIHDAFASSIRMALREVRVRAGLNPTVSWLAQPESSRTRAVMIAHRHVPFLRRFHNGWAARAILRQILHGLRATAKAKAKKN